MKIGIIRKMMNEDLPKISNLQIEMINRKIEFMKKAEEKDELTFYFKNEGWTNWNRENDGFGPQIRVQIFREKDHVEICFRCSRGTTMRKFIECV